MTDQGAAPADEEQPTGRGQEGGYGPFAYLSTPNAALYRRVMRALMAEKERFAVHVRPEQVLAALSDDGGPAVDGDTVAEALDRLAQASWGNLLAFPDSTRVTALEDFYRRRMLYQLSREGELAERALAQYDAALGSRGALQSVALEDIVALLASLRESVDAQTAGGDLDEARVHQALRSLRERFIELAENAVAFMGSIQRTVDLQMADVEAFLAYKEQLIEYLERFISDLVTKGAIIARLLDGFSDDDIRLLVTTAARRESLDAAPGEAEDALDRARARWRRQWRGLTNWFVSTRDRDSEAKLLRTRARSAIPSLLAVVRALHEGSAGRVDRSEDFVTLARWFAALDSDDDRHRLWRTAFGLSSVRHLSVTGDTEDAWAAAELGNSTPWAAAPPVTVSPQLRKSGSYERRGRAVRVTDRSAAKRALAERARAQAEQAEAARRRILTNGPQPLSAFGELDAQAFELLLALLGDALSAMPPGADSSRVHTSDGELAVTLARRPGGGIAVIHTVTGELVGPDHLVDIAPAVGGPAVGEPGSDGLRARTPAVDDAHVAEPADSEVMA